MKYNACLLPGIECPWCATWLACKRNHLVQMHINCTARVTARTAEWDWDCTVTVHRQHQALLQAFSPCKLILANNELCNYRHRKIPVHCGNHYRT